MDHLVPSQRIICHLHKLKWKKSSLIRRNTNNSLLGRETLKKKAEEVLKEFLMRQKIGPDTSRMVNCRTDVAEKLGVLCNRKFVKIQVLDERRKSQLEIEIKSKLVNLKNYGKTFLPTL